MLESVESIVEQWDPQLKSELFRNEESALEKWIAGVKTYHKEYPYILDVPRVAEVLFWLDQHPLLKEFKMENDPIEVRDLRYQMVDYPKIGSLQNRYKGKSSFNSE